MKHRTRKKAFLPDTCVVFEQDKTTGEFVGAVTTTAHADVVAALLNNFFTIGRDITSSWPLLSKQGSSIVRPLAIQDDAILILILVVVSTEATCCNPYQRDAFSTSSYNPRGQCWRRRHIIGEQLMILFLSSILCLFFLFQIKDFMSSLN